MSKWRKILLALLIIFAAVASIFIVLRYKQGLKETQETPGFTPSGNKIVEGVVIDKVFLCNGPYPNPAYTDLMPRSFEYYYDNYGAITIQTETGKTYVVERSGQSYGYGEDPFAGIRKGDKVICEVTPDEKELISWRKE